MLHSILADRTIRPATIQPSAVRFEGVTRRFGDVTAVDAVDLDLRIGQTVALLGPNGAGKSTAIAMMLGLLRPTSGTVLTLGLDPATAVASGRVGAMLQSAALPPNTTVGELVAFARRLYPDPLSADAILDRAGLTAIRGRRTDALSGGEAQRLRFAVAIAGDPDLVFLDEPTVAMDVEMRRTFWADMRRSAAEGRTVLFATHYLDEADEVADRIVILGQGRVIADGTSGAIRSTVRERAVRFELAGGDASKLASLPGVTSVDHQDDRVRLTTTDADATVAAIYATGLAIRHLEVRGADLEDAFVALTTSVPAAPIPNPSTTETEPTR